MPSPVTIVMTTWFVHPERVRVAEQTLKSWNDKLIYEGNIHLHVADDGSELEWKPESFWKRSDITYSRQERHGVGASLNRGFKQAYETSPYVLYMVDDWRLNTPFDITPWVHVLKTRHDVGIVRLGPPHPHLFGRIEPITELWQGWALRLDRHGLVVGHRPEIFHKRMTNYYGWFDERINAQECERLYSVRWAADSNGPDIVLALPHPWFHIDQADLPSTSGVEPC
jgi:glycosyltransferase involved in cell wall biosynthesis